MDHTNVVPAIQYGSRTIVQYCEILNRSVRSEKQIESEKNLRNDEYNGYMSKKTATKVRKYLENWITGIEINKKSLKQLGSKKRPYLTFLTLTLPSKQIHNDNEIKRKLLNAYIIKIKRNHGVKYYYWKAESQKNGNIHFHLIIDKYIHHEIARDEWNETCETLNYVTKYHNKHVNMKFNEYLIHNPENKFNTKEKRRLQYEYSKSENWKRPNSTDIHKLKGVQNTVEYILKYMCKKGDYRKIEGRIHGGSDELKKLKPYQDLVSNDHWNLCNIMNEDKSVKKIEGDYHTIYCCDVMSYTKVNAPMIYKKLINYYIYQNRELYYEKAKKENAKPIVLYEEKKEEITKSRKESIQQDLFNYKNRY